jgi:hypothetical protein
MFFAEDISPHLRSPRNPPESLHVRPPDPNPGAARARLLSNPEVYYDDAQALCAARTLQMRFNR